MPLKITSLRVRPPQTGERRCRALANVIFDQQLMIRNIRLVEHHGQIMIKLPRISDHDHSPSHLIVMDDQFESRLRDAVLNAYESATAEPVE